tara:strand:+ start:821 stop:1084 length:264 start_codon:yes stop_codon:yes gene_type:complete
MNFKELKNKMIEIVGVDNFSDTKENIMDYASNTDGSLIKPKAIVYTENVDEVIAVVKLANQNNWKLYPISRGKIGVMDALKEHKKIK